MLGLPFSRLKRVAGAVGPRDGPTKPAGCTCSAVFASVLQSASKLIFASAAPAVSRREVKVLQG